MVSFVDLVCQCSPYEACSCKGTPELGKGNRRVSHFSRWWNTVCEWSITLYRFHSRGNYFLEVVTLKLKHNFQSINLFSYSYHILDT